MEWLWMPVVAFLALFILVLCWLFFSDYRCCPCRRKRTPECDIQKRLMKSPVHDIQHKEPVIGSGRIHLKYGSKKLRDIVREENGVPILDLHDMGAKEAIQATDEFLLRYATRVPKMIIITGYGKHSVREPVIKPLILKMLGESQYRVNEIMKGGCLEVFYIQ